MLDTLREYFDYRIVLLIAVLVLIGLASIYSATYDAGLSELAFRQFIWAIGGAVVLLTMALLPFKVFQLIAYPSYFLSMLMLVLVLVFGKTVSGSQSWFSIGPLRLQPSEFAKIATALVLATYLSRSDVTLRSFKYFVICSGFVLLPVVLIMLEPDTGTAIIFLAMFLGVLYWGGVSKFTLVAIGAPVVTVVASLFGTTWFLIAVVSLGLLIYITKEHRVAAAVVFSLMVLLGISVQHIRDGLKPYQQKRLETFLDPTAHPHGAGYNVIQAKVAIGSGGLLGKGYLQGTQTQLNFVPEQWTDFILCVPGEEFGFVGATTVLVLFTGLLFRGVYIASIMKNRFGSILAIAITGIFASHVFINVGMSLGLLPVIGVPLPFLSYGGSALVTNMAMAGILINLYANRKHY